MYERMDSRDSVHSVMCNFPTNVSTCCVQTDGLNVLGDDRKCCSPFSTLEGSAEMRLARQALYYYLLIINRDPTSPKQRGKK